MGGRRVLSCLEVHHKETMSPNDEDQKAVNQYNIVANVTHALRAYDADMTEQAWEQSAQERLPPTPHGYLTALQHNLTEQFPSRYRRENMGG